MKHSLQNSNETSTLRVQQVSIHLDLSDRQEERYFRCTAPLFSLFSIAGLIPETAEERMTMSSSLTLMRWLFPPKDYLSHIGLKSRRKPPQFIVRLTSGNGEKKKLLNVRKLPWNWRANRQNLRNRIGKPTLFQGNRHPITWFQIMRWQSWQIPTRNRIRQFIGMSRDMRHIQRDVCTAERKHSRSRKRHEENLVANNELELFLFQCYQTKYAELWPNVEMV